MTTQACSPSTPSVSLQEARAGDEARLDNLLQLYIHDLSAVFTHVELSEEGRYAYPPLPSFLLGAPDRRAFLMRAEGRLAGFIFVKRGSPALPDTDVWDIAEFFVLRRYRRLGVGTAAAARLWETLPRSWTVRVADKNEAALTFWRRVVGAYGAGTVRELAWSTRGEPWTVFHLQPTRRAP